MICELASRTFLAACKQIRRGKPTLEGIIIVPDAIDLDSFRSAGSGSDWLY
jgi:hypothetical protein